MSDEHFLKPERDVTVHRWDREQFRDLLTALKSNRDDTAILTAINDLKETMEAKFMGLREDYDALTAKFDGVESAVTAVADDIAALKTEIAEANDRANIDLSPLMTRAENIEAGLRAAVGAGPGSDPAAPPEG